MVWPAIRVKCPTCQQEGRTSTVTATNEMTTLIATVREYDENGLLLHRDNPNQSIITYRCSNGHSWTERR